MQVRLRYSRIDYAADVREQGRFVNQSKDQSISMRCFSRMQLKTSSRIYAANKEAQNRFRL